MGIRTATIKDTKILTELYNQTIGRNRLVKNYIKRNIIAGKIKVLESYDKILGMYIYNRNRIANPYGPTYTAKQFLWLDQICVWPDEQGQGYGEFLMFDFLDLDVKASEYRLLCDKNLENYYKKFGFEKVDEILHGGRIQLLMSRKKYLN